MILNKTLNALQIGLKSLILGYMRRFKLDGKTVAVTILLVSLGALGYIQYLMLSEYYTLSREKFDQQMANTLAQMGDETYERTMLSNLISAIIREDTVSFPVGIDSLRNAGTQFYRMYLTDRFARANLPTRFEFAIIDQLTNTTYLSSKEYAGGIQWIGNYKVPLEGVIARDCGCAPYLNVRFNRIESVLLQGIQPILLPALACFLLLIIGFFLLLRILREQKYLDRVKNDFINNLTHELKTPVFSISLATRLMREKSDGSMDKYLGQVEQDIAHLKGNVEKVLELASIEDRNNLLNEEEVELPAIFQEWRKEYEGHPEEKRVHVQEEVPQAKIKVDRTHFINALNNLVDNALKYGDAEQPAEVTIRKNGSWAVFAVRDYGEGIDKGDQAAIFNKFYRGKNDQARVRGYGLGLSYVRQVIQMMNGSVSVMSAPDKGSIFEIKLPLIP